MNQEQMVREFAPLLSAAFREVSSEAGVMSSILIFIIIEYLTRISMKKSFSFASCAPGFFFLSEISILLAFI